MAPPLAAVFPVKRLPRMLTRCALHYWSREWHRRFDIVTLLVNVPFSTSVVQSVVKAPPPSDSPPPPTNDVRTIET